MLVVGLPLDDLLPSKSPTLISLATFLKVLYLLLAHISTPKQKSNLCMGYILIFMSVNTIEL